LIIECTALDIFDVKGCVGGVGTVRLRWGSGSFGGCLAGGLRGYAKVSIRLRVWRILGGGKIRQTLCVLFLAEILNKKACPERSRRVLFILQRPKIFKRYLAIKVE